MPYRTPRRVNVCGAVSQRRQRSIGARGCSLYTATAGGLRPCGTSVGFDLSRGAAGDRAAADRGEGVAGQVFVASGCHCKVVFDTDAAKTLQSLYSRPVDIAAAGVGPRGAEQLLDEVDSGLHGDDEALLQYTRKPQKWVSSGPRYLTALGSAHESSDIVHFDSQKVSDAVWQEDAGDTAGDGFIRA